MKDKRGEEILPEYDDVRVIDEIARGFRGRECCLKPR